MASSIFLPRVSGYDINKISRDHYAVSVNNGNIGACVMNKKQFNIFIQDQKEKGNVKPPVAKVGLLTTLGLVALNLLTKGRLFKNAKGLIHRAFEKVRSIFKK